MSATSWWKFMESCVPHVTSWTLTLAPRRSSVDTSSSISKMQFSKTTCMSVCSTLAKGNFSCRLWYEVLKGYSCCCLGRFIHAILQPLLSTLKATRSHNGSVSNSETWSVFVGRSYKTLMFLCYQHIWGLFLIFNMTAEPVIFLETHQRWNQRQVGVHKPRGASRSSKTCSSSF